MRGKVDVRWDDESVLPQEFPVDVEYLWRRMTEETLNKARGKLVLDVGCGRAKDLTEVVKECSDVVGVGVEPSEVMLRKAKNHIFGVNDRLHLVYGIAESLPFKDASFDRVVCKGAIDHFYDPEAAISEMARVVRCGGKVIISVANFESLSCKLGRWVHSIKSFFRKDAKDGQHFWEIPPDHVTKFDYHVLKRMCAPHLAITTCVGVCLLTYNSLWRSLLERLPQRASLFLLRLLDRAARMLPSLSDVIVLEASRHRPPRS